MIEVNDAAHLSRLPDGTIIRWLRIPGDETSEAVAFVRQEIEQPVDPDGRALGALGNPIMHQVTWISPGGWEPMTVEDAGITYPVHVVRLGEDGGHYASTLPLSVIPGLDPLPVPPEGIVAQTLLHGGTWSREKALECSATIFQGLASYGGRVDSAGVLSLADHFETWLDRDPTVWPESPADLAAEAAHQEWRADQAAASRPGNPETAYRAFEAWEDRDRAATGEPTVIVREATEQRQIDVANGLVAAHQAILEARGEFGGQFCTDAALRRMIETAASVYHRLDVKMPWADQ